MAQESLAGEPWAVCFICIGSASHCEMTEPEILLVLMLLVSKGLGGRCDLVFKPPPFRVPGGLAEAAHSTLLSPGFLLPEQFYSSGPKSAPAQAACRSLAGLAHPEGGRCVCWGQGC